MRSVDVVVVGGGQAGLAAGYHLRRRRLATARRRALDTGHTDTGGVASLGDIVAVPPVREARDAGLLKARPMFERLTPAACGGAMGRQFARTR